MNKILIWIIIFNGFTHPRVIIDLLADVWAEEVMNVFVGVFVANVWSDGVIWMLSGVFHGREVDVSIGAVSDGVLTDVNTDVLVVAITTL